MRCNGISQEATLSGVDGGFHFDAAAEWQIIVTARKPITIQPVTAEALRRNQEFSREFTRINTN